MIQDIAPHTYHNEYRPSTPEKDSVILLYQDGMIWLNELENGEIVLPLYGELPENGEQMTYAFTIDSQKYYLLDAKKLSQKPEGYHSVPIRSLRKKIPQHLAFAAITGSQLFHWYQRNRFCGMCGGRMLPDKKERMLYCEQCHNQQYPVIAPAVIVGITKGDKILLTKYAGREYANYALVAGFAEIGETIEETVHREVMEEVGLSVKNLTYYKSQPWSFSDTLLFGFFCEAEEEGPIRLQEDELASAEWVERAEVPADGTDISLTHEMMWMFRQGKV
ncbi:MAG: NAD(+) diphosphatase [bacterium]|nr:NAD(+) diphosphatase [bacterium]